MIGAKRRQEICGIVERAGYAEARQLAAELGVDASTIRRDLDVLAQNGLIQRTHGGALPVANGVAVDLPYAVKQREHTADKRAIARHAADLVADGDSVVLDSGSTTYALAEELAERRQITVATNDLRIAHFLAEHGGVHLVVTGGQLMDNVFTLVGPAAHSGLSALRVNWAFIGADAIDAEAGLTNVNTVEVQLKQAMIEAAARRVLLADSSKFGRRALASVVGIDAFDQIVTDNGLAAGQRPAFGPRLVCVPRTRGAGAVLNGARRRRNG